MNERQTSAPTSRASVVGRLLRAPFSGWAWTSTIHVLLGLPLGVTSFVVVVTFVALTAGLAVTAIFALATLVVLLACVRALSALQRSRFRHLLGVEIVPPAPAPEGPWMRRTLAEGRSGATWRQIAYHLLALPIGVIGYVAVSVAWSAGLAMAGVYGYGWALPRHGLFGWDMRSPTTQALITLIGVLLLLLAPWLAWSTAGIDVSAARALLGRSRSEELSYRVDALSRSRDGVVDAADTERRRIERDLHDGAQQRLVSLAMNLGMARAALAEDATPDARHAIESAHDEAKLALVELRDLVRGLYPAVLGDRGLDAALSGLAARSPVPVEVQVDTADRCSPTIEAVAYFTVAEALTNVAKHAGATSARVEVTHPAKRLRLVVVDNGRGGADPGGGSGLRGLAQRVASVDGALRIDSPAGGPTRIEVELPCER